MVAGPNHRAADGVAALHAMSDLQRFIDTAWDEHVSDAAAVSLRLPLALEQVRDEPGLMALAHLAQHVYGEHLGQWADGLKFMAALGRDPAFQPHGASGAALMRHRGALALAGGSGDVRSTLSTSDAVRVTASAACSLALRDSVRAASLLQEAVAQADAAGLPDQDPAVQALAAQANNIAAGLEEAPAQDEAARALMLQAAALARRFWGRAGGWLEAERAEYRLALCWLRAGDADRARSHAQACLAIVQAQPEAAALERFFAWEALGRIAAAAGDGPGLADARQQAQGAFDALAEADQAWCRGSLDKLAAPPAGA